MNDETKDLILGVFEVSLEAQLPLSADFDKASLKLSGSARVKVCLR